MSLGREVDEVKKLIRQRRSTIAKFWQLKTTYLQGDKNDRICCKHKNVDSVHMLTMLCLSTCMFNVATINHR